jgi:hypothetical protein
MKKLKLKSLEFGAKEALTRTELKKVLGGNGSGWGCNMNPCSILVGTVTYNGYCQQTPGAYDCYCKTAYTGTGGIVTGNCALVP